MGDDDEPQGAGVLLGNRQVLTCAQVVARALRVEVGTRAPSDAVRVDFPGCRLDGHPPRARADPFAWIPREGDRGDIAVLNIEGTLPMEAMPPAFRAEGQWHGARVRIFGHPEEEPGGVWSEALLMGPAVHNELVQLAVQSDHYPIGLRFTGAGVIDYDTGEVIGCVSKVVNEGSKYQMAWMTPLDAVLRHLPEYQSILPAEPKRSTALLAWSATGQIAPPAPLAERSASQTGMAVSTGQERFISLSADQRAMIAALGALVSAQTTTWMNDLVAGLQVRVGSFFVIPTLADGTDGVARLILACLAQPGGMHALLDELHVRYGEPPPSPLQELDQLVVQTVPDPLLVPQERQTLYELIIDANVIQAADAYGQAVGPLGRPLSAGASDVIAIAAELELLNSPPDGLPPLVAFAQALARVLSPARADRIRRWMDGYMTRTGTPGQLALPFEMGYTVSGPSASDPAYLVIRLDPDQQSKTALRPKHDRFSLTAWLQRGSTPGTPLRRAMPPQRLSQISFITGDLLGEAEHTLVAPGSLLTIEFILPRDLLWHAKIDQWPARGGKGPTLGELYPVVVRSLERMYDAGIRPRWERKWAWAAAQCGHPDPSAYLWLPEEDQLPAEEMYKRLAREEYPVCLALGYPPSAPHGLGRDEISVGISAGLPIMVWCREGNESVISSGLRELVSRHGLLGLPRLLADRRSAARRRPGPGLGAVGDRPEDEEQDGLARHLTLLFDPADRRPEQDMTNRAPQ